MILEMPSQVRADPKAPSPRQARDGRNQDRDPHQPWMAAEPGDQRNRPLRQGYQDGRREVGSALLDGTHHLVVNCPKTCIQTGIGGNETRIDVSIVFREISAVSIKSQQLVLNTFHQSVVD